MKYLYKDPSVKRSHIFFKVLNPWAVGYIPCSGKHPFRA